MVSFPFFLSFFFFAGSEISPSLTLNHYLQRCHECVVCRLLEKRKSEKSSRLFVHCSTVSGKCEVWVKWSGVNSGVEL